MTSAQQSPAGPAGGCPITRLSDTFHLSNDKSVAYAIHGRVTVQRILTHNIYIST